MAEFSPTCTIKNKQYTRLYRVLVIERCSRRHARYSRSPRSPYGRERDLIASPLPLKAIRVPRAKPGLTFTPSTAAVKSVRSNDTSIYVALGLAFHTDLFSDGISIENFPLIWSRTKSCCCNNEYGDKRQG